jgi:hypothetical protein
MSVYQKEFLKNALNDRSSVMKSPIETTFSTWCCELAHSEMEFKEPFLNSFRDVATPEVKYLYKRSIQNTKEKERKGISPWS